MRSFIKLNYKNIKLILEKTKFIEYTILFDDSLNLVDYLR